MNISNISSTVQDVGFSYAWLFSEINFFMMYDKASLDAQRQGIVV